MGAIFFSYDFYRFRTVKLIGLGEIRYEMENLYIGDCELFSRDL